MQLGTKHIAPGAVLAPMAGVTDLAFRTICAEHGASMTVSEMVSSRALVYQDKKSLGLMKRNPGTPFGVQLFGNDPQIMAQAAQIVLEKADCDWIDLNMGCPVPKVAANGDGSGLMRTPELAFEIVRQVCQAVPVPVTVKIRKGFDDDHVNAVEIAKIIEEAGAAAVAVHGRTREQYYSGTADWDIIRRVKEAVSIPVIGNGDVTSPQKAEELVRQTGCDGVMIARGAQGNPWIFSEMTAYEQTGEVPARPDKDEVRKMMLRHARLQLEYKGDYLGIREMRKHVAWYTKGIPKAARLREKINAVESYEELENLLTSL